MRLLVTRKPDRSFAKKLKKAGFKTVFLPLIEIKPPRDKGKKLKKKLGSNYDWLVVTSANAAEAIAPFLKTKRDFKTAAVGPATARALKKIDINPRSPKKSGGAASLISFFRKQKIRDKKILYPSSSIARDELKKGLEKMGAKVDCVEAYRTVPKKDVAKKISRIFESGVDAVLFFSPSAVANFPKRMGKKLPIIPFGKTTAQALRDAGIKPAFVPSESNEDVLVRELKKYFSGFPLSPVCRQAGGNDTPNIIRG